jgi:hypothetical protein
MIDEEQTVFEKHQRSMFPLRRSPYVSVHLHHINVLSFVLTTFEGNIKCLTFDVNSSGIQNEVTTNTFMHSTAWILI